VNTVHRELHLDSMRVYNPVTLLDFTEGEEVWVAYDRLCGLVARVPGYRSREPGFNSRRYQIF
jgi:hypothetical protein